MQEATKASQRAGIEAAKVEGKTYLGRKPNDDRKTLDAVLEMLGTDLVGTSEIARKRD